MFRRPPNESYPFLPELVQKHGQLSGPSDFDLTPTPAQLVTALVLAYTPALADDKMASVKLLDRPQSGLQPVPNRSPGLKTGALQVPAKSGSMSAVGV